MPTRRTAEATFVGRQAELAALRARLRDVEGGQGSFVLVSGEAGIGKTRLADELATEVRERGFGVLWGRCWEGEGAPGLLPWTQILHGLGHEVGSETLRAHLREPHVVRLLPDIADGAPSPEETQPGDPAQARVVAFAAIAEGLRDATRAGPGRHSRRRALGRPTVVALAALRGPRDARHGAPPRRHLPRRGASPSATTSCCAS